MKAVSFTEVRNSLKSILDEVVGNADITLITRRDAVVMLLEYFNELIKAVYLLKSPSNALRLEKLTQTI